MHERMPIWLFVAVVFSVLADAQVSRPWAEAISDFRAASQRAAIVVRWSSAIPYQSPAQEAAPGLALTDMARSTNDLLFLSAKADPMAKGDSDHPFLVVGTDRSGPGHLIPLDIRGWSLHLAVGVQQTLWVGGVKNPGVALFGGRVSDAYLAKLGQNGHLVWERQFGGSRERTIQSLAPLPSGDVFVAGRDNNRTWLARISADGRILWERYFGIGKGASVTVMDGKVAVAAFDAAEGASASSSTYREDVVVRIYDDAGQLIDRRVVRQDINQTDPLYAGKVAIESFGDDIYVFSKWIAPYGVKPLEITKLNSHGHAVWRKQPPETVGPEGMKITSCLEAITILQNGEPLVACNWFYKIHLFEFNGQTGDLIQDSLQQPPSSFNCGGVKFLRQRPDQKVWVVGSSSRCTWLGELSLGH